MGLSCCVSIDYYCQVLIQTCKNTSELSGSNFTLYNCNL